MASTERTASLWHYTDVNGLKGMLGTKTNCISLRATNHHHLNDAGEARYLRDLVQRRLRSHPLDRYDEAYRPWVSSLLRTDSLNGDILNPSEDFYVTCFSKAEDSLAQWRTYASGKSSPGVAIVLDAALLEGAVLAMNGQKGEPRCQLVPVKYLKDESDPQFQDLIGDKLPVPGQAPPPMPYTTMATQRAAKEPALALDQRLREYEARVKDSSFTSEGEVRMLLSGDKPVADADVPLECQPSTHGFSYYLTVTLFASEGLVKEVVTSPDSQVHLPTLRRWLVDHGHRGVQVRSSSSTARPLTA